MCPLQLRIYFLIDVTDRLKSFFTNPSIWFASSYKLYSLRRNSILPPEFRDFRHGLIQQDQDLFSDSSSTGSAAAFKLLALEISRQIIASVSLFTCVYFKTIRLFVVYN